MIRKLNDLDGLTEKNSQIAKDSMTNILFETVLSNCLSNCALLMNQLTSIKMEINFDNDKVYFMVQGFI